LDGRDLDLLASAVIEGSFVTVEDVLRRARMLADLGRYDDADPLLAQALAQEPDNEDGLSLLSRGRVARKRFAEAAEASELLLRAHPDSVRGLLGMARIQWLLGPGTECRSRAGRSRSIRTT
jgi:hypothetical protein